MTEHGRTLNVLTTQHWHEGRFNLQMNEEVSVHKHTEVQACSRECLESLTKTLDLLFLLVCMQVKDCILAHK